MRGAGGNDSLVDTTTSCCGQAGGGSDVISGGAGDDAISAEDLVSDVVDGGAGFDRARIDAGSGPPRALRDWADASGARGLAPRGETE